MEGFFVVVKSYEIIKYLFNIRMPNSSFDSLVMPKPKLKKWRVTKKNYNPYDLKPIRGIEDLHKMIANPAVKSLQKRLRECYRRLNRTKMAVTKIEHRSPRSTRRSKRRPSRRSARRSVRRSPKRSRRRRSVRRSPRRRSTRSYRRTDPGLAWARERARIKHRGY